MSDQVSNKLERIQAELGELLCDATPCGARESDADVTVFESLGLAVEDLAAALHIYRQLQERHSKEPALGSTTTTHAVQMEMNPPSH